MSPHHLLAARLGAFVLFVVVLAALGLWLWISRKRLEKQAADAALEAHFRSLERELIEEE